MIDPVLDVGNPLRVLVVPEELVEPSFENFEHLAWSNDLIVKLLGLLHLTYGIRFASKNQYRGIYPKKS